MHRCQNDKTATTTANTSAQIEKKEKNKNNNFGGMQRIEDVKPHLIVGYYKYFSSYIRSVKKNIAPYSSQPL